MHACLHTSDDTLLAPLTTRASPPKSATQTHTQWATHTHLHQLHFCFLPEIVNTFDALYAGFSFALRGTFLSQHVGDLVAAMRYDVIYT